MNIIENSNFEETFIQQQNNSSMSRITSYNTTDANATGLNESSDHGDINTDRIKERITNQRKKRVQNRPKIQWSDRLKIILHLIKEKVGTERGWMKRLYNEWNNQLPMYNMFSKQNLRDQWTRQNITVPEGINLNHLIDQETFEYKEKQKTRTGTIADVVIEGAITDDNEEKD